MDKKMYLQQVYSKIKGKGIPHAEIKEVRNEWMVDRSNLVIAVFNGQKSGTQDN